MAEENGKEEIQQFPLESKEEEEQNIISKEKERKKKEKKKTKNNKSKEEDLSGDKKDKLRTSKDIYDRLKWNASTTKLLEGEESLDLSTIFIGYLDRFIGMRELAFNEYIPGGDIPFHRIYYFRTGGPAVAAGVGKVRVKPEHWPKETVVIWDRESKVDLIFGSGVSKNNKGGDSKQKQKRIDAKEKPTVVEKEQKNGKEEVKENTRDNSGREVIRPLFLRVPNNYALYPSFKYNRFDQNWIVNNKDGLSDQENSTFSLLSFNVLFDLSDPEIVQCRERWPHLIDFIEESDADFIALQEVTVNFLKLLLAQKFVQKYYISEIDRNATKEDCTIVPYGQILLSKMPPHANFVCDNLSKKYLISSFLMNGRILHIANVHLSSNFRGENNAVRRNQLAGIVHACNQCIKEEGVEGDNDVIIVGDTNFTNEEEIDPSIPRYFTDVWRELQPDDAGYTFDVIQNPIAKQVTKAGQCRRYDRIFISSNNLTPTSIQMVGTELIDPSKHARCEWVPSLDSALPLLGGKDEEKPLPLSDHYGLLSTFSYSSYQPEYTRTDPPVHTSAVIIIPPQNIWNPIQFLRQQFDPSYIRWMPHINLLFGFIKDEGENFDMASEVFSEALKRTEPFITNFRGLQNFQHGKACTVYLEPGKGNEEIKLLQRTLQAEYPFCAEQSHKSGVGFIPHCKVAQLASGKDSSNKQNNWEKEYSEQWNGEWLVDRIYIISREGDQPFRIKKTVFLGSSQKSKDAELEKDEKLFDHHQWRSNVSLEEYEPEDIEDDGVSLEGFLKRNRLMCTKENQEARNRVLGALNRLCTEALKMEPNYQCVKLIGSAAMGFHHNKSDMDAVCCGLRTVDHSQFHQLIKTKLEEQGQASDVTLVQVIGNAIVPLIRLEVEGIEVDLLYTTCTHPENASENDLKKLSPASLRSAVGYLDSVALYGQIPHDKLDMFRNTVKAVKYWAVQRQIIYNGAGFFGGFAYSIMVSHIFSKFEITSSEQALERFFEYFGDYDAWKHPITFDGNNAKGKYNTPQDQHLVVSATSYPYVNAARNFTAGTKQILLNEFKEAQEIFRREDSFRRKWEAASQPCEFFSEFKSYLKIELSSLDIIQHSQCKGYLDSKLVSLTLSLESLGVMVRPSSIIFTNLHEKVPWMKPSNFPFTATLFMGLAPGTSSKGVDIGGPVGNFAFQFYKWDQFPEGALIDIKQIKGTSKLIQHLKGK